MPPATLIFRDKLIFPDGTIQEIVIWKLPTPDSERPHALKYSLFYGVSGKRLVGYDNERGKGDHRHYGDEEKIYLFHTVEELIQDFESDVARIRGELNETTND